MERKEGEEREDDQREWRDVVPFLLLLDPPLLTAPWLFVSGSSLHLYFLLVTCARLS